MTVSILIVSSMAGTAMAQDAVTPAGDDGFYLGAGIGGNLVPDIDLDGSGINTAVSMAPGVAGTVTFGHRFANGLRPELEMTYRRNEVDNVNGTVGSTGTVSSWSTITNIIYDLETGNNLRPYVGVGAGVSMVSMDSVSPVGNTRIDDLSVSPLLQGIAGLSYRFVDELEGFADYRYVTTFEGEFRSDAATDINADMDSHTVMLGMRWYFNDPGKISSARDVTPSLASAESEGDEPAAAMAPAVATQPPPEPQPVQVVETAPEPEAQPEPEPRVLPQFLVFFGFDKSVLTPEALDIIRIAAKSAEEGQPIRIDATGHADRSGSSTYNQALSVRRAEAVRTALVSMGIAATDISITGKGEASPLVKTADGVREAQNRRVEIVLN